MPKVPTPYYWADIDLDPLCRNWRQTPAGSNKRMGTSFRAAQILAQATNRMLARYPRIWFAKAMPQSATDATGSDPLYNWKANDAVDNAREYTVHVIALPRTGGAGDCYAAREGGAATAQTPLANNTPASADFRDAFHVSYPVVRGAVTDSEITEGISTFNGYTIIDVVVQDDELLDLDTSIHRYVDEMPAKAGKLVVADILEDIRADVHEARTTNLGMSTCWSAQAAAGSWATPGSTDQTGIVIASGTIVNVIDQSYTSRTAISPGVTCHVENCGIGPEDEDAGKQVKVMCRVLGAVSGGSVDGTVRFQGPDHIANNYTDITVTNGAAAWYGNSTNFIYLDPTKAYDVATTGRNKIDIFGWIQSRTVEIMYLYGLPSWITV